MREMNILYKVHNNIYVNLTNRCSSNCEFCLRSHRDKMGDSGSLWLSHEPTIDEIKKAFKDRNMDEYNEVVFCGFGEPTERLDVLIEAADFVKKEYNKKIRINTNGQGNLINEKDITPLFKDRFDSVSISLNTPDEDKYNEIVKSIFGKKAFKAMISFVNEVKKYVPEVVLTTVETTISKEDEEKCAKICEDLGVKYRIRPYED